MELIKATTDDIQNKEEKVIKSICKNIYIKDISNDPSWTVRPNLKDQINKKPDDRKTDQTTE